MKGALIILAGAALAGAASPVRAKDLGADYAAASAQVQAQAPIDVPAGPASMRFACNDRFDYVLPSFKKNDDGSYAIELLLHFRRGEARYSQDHWKSLVFSIEDGRIERDGRRLVYVKDGRSIPVGQTRWWYEPKWYPAKNAKIRERTTRLSEGLCEISQVALALRPQP